MGTKISDLVLMSDVDGTLITADGQIPQRNLDALRRFTQGGGRFALSTGRSILYSKDLAAKLPINFPCVLFNGGMLYDYSHRKILHQEFLPQHSKQYFREIAEQFPEAEVLVVDEEHYNEISLPYNQHTRPSAHRTRFCSIDDIMEKNWYKGLIILDESRMQALKTLIAGKNYVGVRFVNTMGSMIEMLPSGSSKGEALTRLMKTNDFSRDNLVVIGDYYNDMEMISLAGLGVTLMTSPDDIKQSADLVVGTCENGAVADLIEYLESRYSY